MGRMVIEVSYSALKIPVKMRTTRGPTRTIKSVNGTIWFTHNRKTITANAGHRRLNHAKHSTCSNIYSGENPDNPGVEYDGDGALESKAKKVSLGAGISTDPVPTPGKTFVTTTGNAGDDPDGGLGPKTYNNPVPSAGRMIYWYEGEY